MGKASKPTNKLSDEECLFFYNVLYICETEIRKDKTGYDIDKTINFRKENNLILMKKKSKEIKAHKEINTIYFTDSKDSYCASFLTHIRNSFAHCLLLKDGDYYIIQDKCKKKNSKGKKTEFSMYGIIKQELLQELIIKMEETKKRK